MRGAARLWPAALLLLLLGAAAARAEDCAQFNSIVIQYAIDMSPSMSGERQQAASAFGLSLLDKLRDTGHLQRAGSLYFTSCPVATERPISTDLDVIRSDLEQVGTIDTDAFADCGNGTAVYDAIIEGATRIHDEPSSRTRLYVVLTDGEHSGTDTTPEEAAIALLDGVSTELILIANSGDPGHAGLQEIAAAAGPHVQVRATTDLMSIVSSIVDRACSNFRPTARFSITPSELHLAEAGPRTIFFNGNASTDTEGPIAAWDWTITRPDGSSFTGSGRHFEPAFDDSQLANGEVWEARLRVTDEDGATHTADTQTFRVTGAPPTVAVSGPTEIDVLEDIELTASGEDPDGGTLTYSWDIVSAPPGSQNGPQSGFALGPNMPALTTTEDDIGTFVFRATGTDNEQDTDSAEHTVEVLNLPPEIDLTGDTSIDVGDPIVVATTILKDVDGGALSFSWDIVQSPDPAGIEPQEDFFSGIAESGATLTIETTEAHAGTWVVRLTATDDDNQENSSVSESYTVLVDAPPVAAIDAPEIIGSLSFPLQLDGRESIDPDTDVNHSRLDGQPLSLSAGINGYTWRLVDVPYEVWEDYTPGPLGESLGIPGTSPTASIGFGMLVPGDWVFELEVRDGENNSDAVMHNVTVVEEEGPPVAVTSGPVRGLVDPNTNRLLTPLALDGTGSYDLDNLLLGDPPGPGLGITGYLWEVVLAPPGCTAPSPGAGPQVELFPVGATIDPACLGYWIVALTVEDDDPTPRTNTTAVELLVGNCPELLCIDHPTRAVPKFVTSGVSTDVPIYWHLDAGVYGLVAFVGSGLFARLEIFHESDTDTPFFAHDEPDPLSTAENGFLTFHWDGFSNDIGNGKQRPPPGKYHVRITLQDSALTASSTFVEELEAIHVETAEPEILPVSDVLESADAFRAGTNSLRLQWEINGPAPVDHLELKIYDTTGAVVFTRTDSISARSGTLEWNGALAAPSTFLGRGQYEAELQAMRLGIGLGTSPRHAFTVIRTDLDVDANRDGVIHDTADETGENAWTAARGAIFAVNFDRDGSRTEGAALLGDAVDFGNDGVPRLEDDTIDNADDAEDITPMVIRGAGTPLPPEIKVFLRVAELEDIQSVHVFEKTEAGTTAFWGKLGSRIINGQAETLEKEITHLVDPASPLFAGEPPAGDARFGLEGMFFRQTGTVNPFDGQVDFTIEYRSGATVLFSDSVRLKVAPWIMLPHTVPSEELWAIRYTDNSNAAFLDAAGPDYVGLDDSGELHTVEVSNPFNDDTQWFQDHVETGYYHRPGGPKTRATFRLPYKGGQAEQPRWVQRQLLRPGFGIFQYGRDLDPDHGSNSQAGSYGGNLEVMPPTAAHPLGRIVVGTTRSDKLREFLDAQEVQPPVEVPTEWLHVGHVDEMLAFDTTASRVIVADPADAWAIMEAIPPAERGRSVFFATGRLPQDGVVTAAAAEPDRLQTGIDLTGTSWKYVRIYRDGGSGAAGQIAHIVFAGDGFIQVDWVWQTGSRLIGDDMIHDWMTEEAPRSSFSWFVAPQPGDRYVLVEGTRFWKDDVSEGTPAIVTVEEVLADPNLETLNNVKAAAQIADARAALEAAAGGGLTFIPVPVIYVGTLAAFEVARGAVAFTPGLSNMQPAGGALYFPRQFGPRNALGEDLFEKVTRERVPLAEFVDDWDVYHRNMGEVHCGSTVVREPLPLDWWEHLP